MASKTLFTSALLLLGLISCASAHNITKILNETDGFNTFNNLLSQTKIADEINRRQTITVLAVADSAASAFAGLDAETLKKALSVHVILDYYDNAKITNLAAKKSTLLTTLFQSSGVATDHMGFLNFTKRVADGKKLFGSAEPGAPLSSEFMEVVTFRPYNISVLQVSAAIIPPGLGGHPQEVPISPPPVGAPDAPSPDAESPADDAEAPADAPASDSPAPAPVADGPSPAAEPAADSPAKGKSTSDEADKSGAVKVAASVFGALFFSLFVN
ncbi:hypothetical protein LUZ60_002620 [Juncus effusus]|nr:hypothetical protein LUZ60_002620 [Juncus effusus]